MQAGAFVIDHSTSLTGLVNPVVYHKEVASLTAPKSSIIVTGQANKTRGYRCISRAISDGNYGAPGLLFSRQLQSLAPDPLFLSNGCRAFAQKNEAVLPGWLWCSRTTRRRGENIYGEMKRVKTIAITF